MKIFDKYLEEWGAAEVDRLIELEVEESRTIEFKRELKLEVLNKSDAKKKFLFNVAAFINTDGGAIFFGIDDSDENGKNTGVAQSVCPIEVQNRDTFDQQISDIINTNLDPSYSHSKIHFIPYHGKYVIAVELQKGIGMPRMVSYKNKWLLPY